MIRNKKAVEINVATVIIVILAILVLVILSLFFTGGLTSLWDRIRGTYGVYGATVIADAKNLCEKIYTPEQFCMQPVSIYNSKTGVYDSKMCYEDPIYAKIKVNEQTIDSKFECDELGYTI
ncbi:MAG: hypothetical protein K6T16_00475 [Candidatus Pacearchaeota archaeon]|nr:hypothetical protein [Candidatus Pacearchaeota archaeon]